MADSKRPIPEECKNCPDRETCEELTDRLRSALARYEIQNEEDGKYLGTEMTADEFFAQKLIRMLN